MPENLFQNLYDWLHSYFEQSDCSRVSVQGVKSLGGHFACLCRGFEFYEVKKKIVIIFQKENGNTFTLFIIFIVKSLQKEQNSTNLLLWPPICRNKPAITPKWFNSLDTNSIARGCFQFGGCSQISIFNSLEKFGIVSSLRPSI